MKALRFAEFGPPSVLTVEGLEIPKPAQGEALVEVRAAAINPSDVKNVAGFFAASLPRTPGRDYAGVVVEGDGWKGREVWGSGAGLGVTRDGTYAQFLAVPLDWLSEKPARFAMEQAAGVGVPYITAWSALVDACDIRAGETVLVTGVLGAVGRAAVQIAHWKNAKVIGAARSDEITAADMLIDTSVGDLAEKVRALTGGKGADLVLDTVGGALFEPALRSLRVGGRQVCISSSGKRKVEIDLIDFYHNESKLMGVDSMKLSGPAIAKIMDQLRPGFEGGHLKTAAITTWNLDRAREAYVVVEKGGARGRQVLLPQ